MGERERGREGRGRDTRVTGRERQRLKRPEDRGYNRKGNGDCPPVAVRGTAPNLTEVSRGPKIFYRLLGSLKTLLRFCYAGETDRVLGQNDSIKSKRVFRVLE